MFVKNFPSFFLCVVLSATFLATLNAQEATVIESTPTVEEAQPSIVGDVVYGHKMGMALTLMSSDL